MITPQPTTLNDLVEKVREIDKNWQIYGQGQTGAPRRSFTRRGRGIAEITTESPNSIVEVAANQTRGRGRGRGSNFPRRGRLSPEERSRLITNILGRYCGAAGHRAKVCIKPPN